MKGNFLKAIMMAMLLLATAAASWGQEKILHYTETTGYNHNTKAVSLAMFQNMGQAHGWTIVNDDNGTQFSDLANLQTYDLVVFSNTSGSGGLSASQRANFETYINSGGSYLGIHAASDTYRHSSANGSSTGVWDWYAETVAGASVQQSPNHTNSSHTNTMTQQQPGHPALAALPSPWTKTEEYYYWQNGYLSGSFTELLQVGQTGGNSYDAPRMMAHCRDLPGGGRAFYTALGHSASNYQTDQNFIQLIENATTWILSTQSLTSGQVDVTTSGQLMTWHRVAITMDGPDQFSETGTQNPFTDIRLVAIFTGPDGRTYTVPGHYAADGQAGESGASSGSVWRVYFSPDTAGLWTWQVSCRQGNWVAIDTSQTAGTVYLPFDTLTGSFTVVQSNKNGPDNRAKGRLQYIGGRYRIHMGNHSHFLNIGADAPENFLAYWEFDQTANDGGNNYDLTGTASYGAGFAYSGDGLHHYAAHVQDWTPSDPVWHGGKGKGIIGALNYLASEGLNAFSGLLWNVGGDGDDVWPYISDNDLDRLDVSKLDQWEIVFSHADSLGMLFHAKLFETENDQDMNTQQWQLYFREMASRFGHHLAWTWNLGEENTMPAQHIRDQARLLDYWDAYDHHRVLHTYPADNWRDEQWLPQLGDPTTLTGISIQDGPNDTPDIIEQWLAASAAAGHQWVANWDEQNGASSGVQPDGSYPGAAADNHAVMRRGMWQAFIIGAEGMKCYFGYNHQHNDIDCEDFRSRDQWWDYMRHLKSVFLQVPFWAMDYVPGIDPQSNDNWGMTDGQEWWLVYRSDGDALNLNLPAGTYQLDHYRVTDGAHQSGGSISAAGQTTITQSQSSGQEWATVLHRSMGTLPIGWDYVNAHGHQVCWGAVDSDSVQVERLTGDAWQVVAVDDPAGCYEFTGCDGLQWFRLRAMNDLETQGRGVVSDAFVLRSRPMPTGGHQFPCGAEQYVVRDITGREVARGYGAAADLTGLPAGIYHVQGESTTIMAGVK